VIGNDAYENVAKLQKAGNDATAMARELRAAGFEVQLHRDVNYRNMGVQCRHPQTACTRNSRAGGLFGI
jgi:uncharacterized caspase-like protein